MKIVKSSKNKPIATAWVTAPDISGTGVTEVKSDIMHIDMTTLPEWYDFYIEVRAAVSRPGGTGNAKVYAIINGYGESLVTDKNTSSVLKYTTVQEANTATLKNRKWIIKPSVLQGIGTAGTERMQVYVAGIGSEADTEFAVSDIKFRLLIFPL